MQAPFEMLLDEAPGQASWGPSKTQPLPPQSTINHTTKPPNQLQVRVFPVLGDVNAEFVIVATDGVWDLLTNEEAVAFVGGAIAEGDVAHVSQR